MIPPSAPEHMTRWVRNERLYRHLLGLGLVVNPVFTDEARTQIDHLIVSVDLPLLAQEVAQMPAQGGVVTPIERTKVDDPVAPAEGAGDNVVDFPPVL